MARKVILQPTAERDVANIADWLACSGGQVTQRFLAAFEKQADLLAEGIVEHWLSRFETLAVLGYRTAYFEQYVILYYVAQVTVFIAHIFHQSQDYTHLV